MSSSTSGLRLVQISGPLRREREVQIRFGAHRLRGEWFAPAEEIIEYFSENGIFNEAQK